jgi:hypothetical protein
MQGPSRRGGKINCFRMLLLGLDKHRLPRYSIDEKALLHNEVQDDTTMARVGLLRTVTQALPLYHSAFA